jgi:hypothetical protein
MEDRRVEQPGGRPTRVHSRAQRSDEPRVDIDPLAEGAIEP